MSSLNRIIAVDGKKENKRRWKWGWAMRQQISYWHVNYFYKHCPRQSLLLFFKFHCFYLKFVPFKRKCLLNFWSWKWRIKSNSTSCGWEESLWKNWEISLPFPFSYSSPLSLFFSPSPISQWCSFWVLLSPCSEHLSEKWPLCLVQGSVASIIS